MHPKAAWVFANPTIDNWSAYICMSALFIFILFFILCQAEYLISGLMSKGQTRLLTFDQSVNLSSSPVNSGLLTPVLTSWTPCSSDRPVLCSSVKERFSREPPSQHPPPSALYFLITSAVPRELPALLSTVVWYNWFIFSSNMDALRFSWNIYIYTQYIIRSKVLTSAAKILDSGAFRFQFL